MSRRLHEKDLSGHCYVYCLIDPRNNKPFYIGVSKYPWGRLNAHASDRCSAAWPVVRSLLDAKVRPDEILKIYKRCPDRNSALDLEHRLISTTPGLVNLCRTRSQMFEYSR